MRPLLIGAALAGLLVCGLAQPAAAQSGSQAVRAPCTQFGSAAGTCLQGGSPAVVTTLAGKNAITSVTPGAAALTGGTSACETSHGCDSLSGEIKVVVGTGTPAAGTLFTIVFADTRTSIPNCTVQIRNITGAVGVNANSFYATPSTTGLVVTADTAGFTASTTLDADYFCGGN